MFKKRVTMLSSTALAATLLVTAPTASFGVEKTAESTDVTSAPVHAIEAPNTFLSCETVGTSAPASISLGSNLGPGISESIDPSTLKIINHSRETAGKQKLPTSVAAMRYMDSGEILTLDKRGRVIEKLASGADAPVAGISGIGVAQPAALLHPEVKRIIGACLGFGGAGGMGFEALVRYLTTPANAITFVIRRIGIAGAISCVGGVIRLYI